MPQSNHDPSLERAAMVRDITVLNDEAEAAKLLRKHPDAVMITDGAYTETKEHVTDSGRHGFETAVKGASGFVCIVGRGWTSAPDSDYWNPQKWSDGTEDLQAAPQVHPSSNGAQGQR